MQYDVIIIGGGPGGLACAETLGRAGVSVLVLEKNILIGKKVCAGGITWNGLLRKAPGEIAERDFLVQRICSRFQKAVISSKTPIIATVNRQRLGQAMMSRAQAAGAEIKLGMQVKKIGNSQITVKNKTTHESVTFSFKFLVGADGSSSLVRRFLNLPSCHMGIGINYQIPGFHEHMEWHIDNRLFGNGYAWIFPHESTISVGAYAAAGTMPASALKSNLILWAAKQGKALKGRRVEAELINYDYRGYSFGNIFLVGDAAGLASGLTGEGIYSAIVSGESVAQQIKLGCGTPAALQDLIASHRRHQKLVQLTQNRSLTTIAATEAVILGLRTGLIDFSSIEMAYSKNLSQEKE